ncbi:MAG: hypothetical protein ABI379_00850 [Rhodanobacter sp.]
MNIFQRMAALRRARARAGSARAQWHTATSGLLSHGRAHPVAMLGAAAGVGLLMGRCNVRIWRVPGLGALLGGGLAEGVALATRLIGEFGLAGLAGRDAPEDTHDRVWAGDKRTS